MTSTCVEQFALPQVEDLQSDIRFSMVVLLLTGPCRQGHFELAGLAEEGPSTGPQGIATLNFSMGLCKSCDLRDPSGGPAGTSCSYERRNRTDWRGITRLDVGGTGISRRYHARYVRSSH
ncbi:hypothetical protein PR048_021370 [Dryococelus australis]|uniref:Uncharacterized protein n=1 Tax=Dryococelus australis TaxID=614101 RepID=A0ABQ9GY23_9NEOP|nr:hypothetical protein PR048_021370 [Dryococelus australis]